MDASSELQSVIDFYARSQLWRHVAAICEREFGGSNDELAHFWHGVALSYEGAASEAVRELEPLQRSREMGLAVNAALINAHKNAKSKDKEAMDLLKDKLKKLSKDADDSGLIFAGRYFLHTDKAKQARQCLEKVHAKDANNIEVLVLLGWLNLAVGQSRQARQALGFFEAALQRTSEKPHIGALLGRSKYHERPSKVPAGSSSNVGLLSRVKWDRVLADLNSLIVAHPSFAPGVVEKARVLLLAGSWEEALATAQRVLSRQPRDLLALRVVVLVSLMREPKASIVAQRITDLLESIEVNEPRNAPLLHDTSAMLARLCARSPAVLHQSLVLIERACALDASNSQYLSEQAIQLLMLEEAAASGNGAGAGGAAAGGVSAAALAFAEAAKLDESNVMALAGGIKCKIISGKYKEARQELDFIAEITATTGGITGGALGVGGQGQAELTYLHALLLWRADNNEPAALDALTQAMSEHAAAVESGEPGLSYYQTYNPDFVLEVAHAFMQMVGGEAEGPAAPTTSSVGGTSSPGTSASAASLAPCIRLLIELTRLVPSLVGAHFLLARAYYLAGHLNESERSVGALLALQPTCAPAYILQAQIALRREQYQSCSSHLEQARALSFDCRNTPIYHLLKAKLLEASGQKGDALKVILAAMELPGVKKSKSMNASGSSAGAQAASAAAAAAAVSAAAAFNPAASIARAGAGLVSLHERISIYLALASVHASLGNQSEAAKAMSAARAEFAHTRESTRILLADAQLATQRRDFDAAINMLKSVKSDSAYYAQAKMQMAEIYLVHKKNKKAYVACFEDLARGTGAHTLADPTNIQHSILLGEAYLRIQEPMDAIGAFEQALALRPGDAELSSKIGRALVSTHDYARAVSYYERAATGAASGMDGEGGNNEDVSPLSISTRLLLLHDLAELYQSLKRHDDAMRVLDTAMQLSSDAARESASSGVAGLEEELTWAAADVKSLSLQAEVAAGAGDSAIVSDSLTRAWQLQVDLLSRRRSDANPEQRRLDLNIAADLCFRLAEVHRTGHQLDKAQQFYHEALKYNEAHTKSRLALAQLHLLNNELDACQDQCVTLLRLEPTHREASLMLADLMFRKNEHEAASYHFQQLLEKNPTRYDALHKLLQLLRRAGRLSDAPRFIKLSERAYNPLGTSSGASAYPPGLHYCKGLYAWYSNDAQAALREFNQCRKDGEWGAESLQRMVEIYLNPDHNELFQESNEAKGDNSEQIAAADKLMADLKVLNEPSLHLKIVVLEAYVHMASKNKSRVEQALTMLLQLCSTDATRDYVPGLLAMSNAFVLKGEPAKARNQLKRISKMSYDPEYSTEFERSWLMLGDIYIQVGKYEFAQELCKKCLSVNKSSAKAWEMLGIIMEKEQAYKDAADHYEQAWNFMHQSSPAIGYKLAFNYLKAKRFLEAIDVCHKVLAAFPDYPKIRKDILAKAREALRP